MLAFIHLKDDLPILGDLRKNLKAFLKAGDGIHDASYLKKSKTVFKSKIR